MGHSLIFVVPSRDAGDRVHPVGVDDFRHVVRVHGISMARLPDGYHELGRTELGDTDHAEHGSIQVHIEDREVVGLTIDRPVRVASLGPLALALLHELGMILIYTGGGPFFVPPGATDAHPWLLDPEQAPGGFREVHSLQDLDWIGSSSPEPRPVLVRESGGFAAGTLVHTPSGQRPIEQLRAGDLVYSAPTDDVAGIVERRVLRVRRREEAPLVRLRCWSSATSGTELIIAGHPAFCVVGLDLPRIAPHARASAIAQIAHRRWFSAGLLRSEHQLAIRGQREVALSALQQIWRGRALGEGWIELSGDSTEGYPVSLGTAPPSVGAKLVVHPEAQNPSFSDRHNHPEIFSAWVCRGAVYDLEVEDPHTYFVGEAGLWVYQGTDAPLEPLWTAVS